MNIPSRQIAQQRSDQIQVFQKELGLLEQEGVVALSGEKVLHTSATPYEVSVAFGKRLEPWITTAANTMAVNK